MRNLFKYLFILLTFTVVLNATTFHIKSDFPKQTIWVKKLLNDSLKELNKMFLNKYVKLPDTINVTIKQNRKMTSISANASRYNNSINFSSNIWQKDKYRVWIMIHELTNLLSSYYGSKAYPSDWWANGRSPFPEYISILIMQKIGFKKEALWRKGVHKDKSDHKFYWVLHKKFGTKIFKDFFYLIKKYNIDLAKVGKSWPHPDKKRSLATLSFLSLSAKKNLANLAKIYKIGEKPKDWEQRHSEIRFIPYTISKKEINEFLKTYLSSSK